MQLLKHVCNRLEPNFKQHHEKREECLSEASLAHKAKRQRVAVQTADVPVHTAGTATKAQQSAPAPVTTASSAPQQTQAEEQTLPASAADEGADDACLRITSSSSMAYTACCRAWSILWQFHLAPVHGVLAS